VLELDVVITEFTDAALKGWFFGLGCGLELSGGLGSSRRSSAALYVGGRASDSLYEGSLVCLFV
jgi:hypothetical protein